MDVAVEDQRAPVTVDLRARVHEVRDRVRAWTPQQRVQAVVDVVILGLCLAFVFAQLHPSLIFRDNTPAGGDMGAHVWAPAYLRDHLLPHGRLTGWTPDWYAGFPAYHFYMVVPSLLILALDAGLGGPLAIVPLALGLGVMVAGWGLNLRWLRRLVMWVGAAIVVLGVGIPYGIAFKLVTIAGLLALPVCAYVFGRLVRLAFPMPAMLAIATVPYLFDRHWTIYGGNVASTLAGEFAFSISLAFAVLYLGVVFRGLETGRYRALAAVLLALTGLCHLIPAFFALGGTVVAFLMRPARARARWLLTMAPVAGLIAAFWVLPFYARKAYMNDMGWEKEVHYELRLFHDVKWVLVLAAVGAVLSIVQRVRGGIYLTGMAALWGATFVVMPQARLWNARLLPFYYLCAYLLAAVGVALAVRALVVFLSLDPRRPSPVAGYVMPFVALGLTLIVVALPLGVLPGERYGADKVYRWKVAGVTLLHTKDRSFVPDWARWNYSGYEGKEKYPEYHAVVQTMAGVGKRLGCGRAMWEYEKELDQYGTPMALMLLPHWTDGCIGSMEGLYFEASATTPYHFLMQSELSAAPSRAQRDLPYRNFDLQQGIQHMQLLGVRYYMTISAQATTAAKASSQLTEVATSGPWTIFEVHDSALVTGLRAQPAVIKGVQDAQRSWLDPSIAWYQDPTRWNVFLASSGPEAWQRVRVGQAPVVRRQPPVKVSGVRTGDDRISFDVDRIGVPVLVKASYFPNWKSSGAKGPYRVTPNLMVVIPTSKHVSLHYGWTGVDIGAWLLTFIGIGLAIVLARKPAIVMPEPKPARFRPRWFDDFTDTGEWATAAPEGDEGEPAGRPVDEPVPAGELDDGLDDEPVGARFTDE